MIVKEKKVLFGTMIAYGVMMLIFTFADLRAALMIYNADSVFARCFEIVGTLPMPFIAVFACVALLMTDDRAHGVRRLPVCVLIYFLLAFLVFYACLSFGHAVSGGWIPLLILAAAWVPVSKKLIRGITGKGNQADLRRAAFIALCGCAAAVFGPMLIKEIMSRPRFYLLENPVSDFTFWFVRHPHTPTSADTSFPSGHSAQAVTCTALLLIPMFIEKCRTKRYSVTVLCAASAFTVCVMVSRMILGMHYATDVITGSAIPVFAMEAALLYSSSHSMEEDGMREELCDLKEKYGTG